MTDRINDGGPAFPFGENRYDGGNHYLGKQYAPGMTLRDYFAGQVVAGMMANATTPFAADVAECDPREIADAVFEIADAMIAAREGGAA